MIEILRRIFIETGFQWTELEITKFGIIKSAFAILEGSNRCYYFLILQSSQIDPFLNDEVYLELAELLKGIEGYNAKTTDKNTYLLLVQEVSSTDFMTGSDPDNLKLSYFRIEENPYLFKKHVLFFASSQLGALSNAMNKESKSTNAFLHDHLISSEEFRSFFKNPTKAGSYYGIVSQLFIKLPFLKVEPQTGVGYSLQDQIEKTMKDEELLDLGEDVFDTSLEDESPMTDKELDLLINKWTEANDESHQ